MVWAANKHTVCFYPQKVWFVGIVGWIHNRRTCMDRNREFRLRYRKTVLTTQGFHVCYKLLTHFLEQCIRGTHFVVFVQCFQVECNIIRVDRDDILTRKSTKRKTKKTKYAPKIWIMLIKLGDICSIGSFYFLFLFSHLHSHSHKK